MRPLCVLAVVLVAVVRARALAQTDVPVPPPPSATEIFDRARARVEARTLPPFIAYMQETTLLRRGKAHTQLDRIILRTSDGKINITHVPESPADRVDTTPAVADRPRIRPTADFGLAKHTNREPPSAFEAPDPPPQASGPTVIGRVASISRDYDVTFVETSSLDGARVYHLRLEPRVDPRHHPIRELFVDTATYDPRRIISDVYAGAGPVHIRPRVTVDYAPVAGTWLIRHAFLDFVVRIGFFAYGGSGDFRTRDISFPAVEPAWLFDKALLAEHLAHPDASPAAVPTDVRPGRS